MTLTVRKSGQPHKGWKAAAKQSKEAKMRSRDIVDPTDPAFVKDQVHREQIERGTPVERVARAIEKAWLNSFAADGWQKVIARAAIAAMPTVDRQWIIELIQNEYDPAPSHYKLGDSWDDGSGRIADKIIERLNDAVLAKETA